MRGYVGESILDNNNYAKLARLHENGLIILDTKNIDGINGWTGRLQTWRFFTVALTEEGRKYLVSESDVRLRLRACEIVLGDIAGIQVMEQFNVAEVTYTLETTTITPFGVQVCQQQSNRRESFSFFDDGWRID
jgi:hypothetical protein